MSVFIQYRAAHVIIPTVKVHFAWQNPALKHTLRSTETYFRVGGGVCWGAVRQGFEWGRWWQATALAVAPLVGVGFGEAVGWSRGAAAGLRLRYGLLHFLKRLLDQCGSTGRLGQGMRRARTIRHLRRLEPWTVPGYWNTKPSIHRLDFSQLSGIKLLEEEKYDFFFFFKCDVSMLVVMLCQWQQ